MLSHRFSGHGVVTFDTSVIQSKLGARLYLAITLEINREDTGDPDKVLRRFGLSEALIEQVVEEVNDSVCLSASAF